MSMLYLRNKPIGAISSGGSGGGHVIENASGTDLAQRDTLKFSGYLQATDDSTNEKSVVSDAPNEVEYSVWQTMTDAQKTGKKWIIKNVPSSGSSGGHTIENPSGTDMTQRSNLQFTDAEVTDDSTNDRTEISIVRKLTQAEFDELTPEEQNRGVIVIKDANPIYLPSDNAVSVTADGVKTYGQLFNELYALTDATKVTRNAKLTTSNTSGGVIYNIERNYGTSITFIKSRNTNSDYLVETIWLGTTSAYYLAATEASSTTFTNSTNTVPASGITFTLYYNILPSVEVEEDYLTVSIAGLASTNQNSTTGLYYAVVDLSARIPEGNEITAVNAINNFDCFYYMPNGRRLVVCSPQSYSLSASITRDLHVWYKKL